MTAVWAEVKPKFEQASGHKLDISFGVTPNLCRIDWSTLLPQRKRLRAMLKTLVLCYDFAVPLQRVTF